MSWDIFIQHFPDGAKRVADVPDTFMPDPIGKRDDVIAKIRSVCPQADFTDPTWGKVHADDYSLEMGLGDDDPVRNITLHARGSDGVLSHVSNIVRALGLRAIDSWTGEFFDSASAGQSLARWRSYIEDEG